jgi:hypothetical protein
MDATRGTGTHFWKLDLAEANVLVHLLRVLCIERGPAAAHLEEKDAERPEVDQLRVAVVV